MKNVHTAPMEVLSGKPNGTFSTEPHEAGWADEALAMIYVREVHGPAPKLVLRAEISADGARWMDHAAPPLAISQPGAHYLALKRFGNWLRVSGEVTGGPADGATAVVLDFYWVLKG
jgi:hypothetical protein